MNTNIYIPSKINVGYQERSDTYTGKLAYVIYYDERGKLRKEGSWNTWRDENLGNDIFDNEPMEGFVLNKKVGGTEESYGWNPRKTYTRVYDPRGFEFEISIPNLLWILECCDSIRGKGLCGQFCYGIDGTELILVPCDSPDYKQIKESSDIRNAKQTIKAKDLIIGATYLHKNGSKYVYMGKYDFYNYGYRDELSSKVEKRFYFVELESIDKIINKGYESGERLELKSTANTFVKCIDDSVVDCYADLYERLEGYKCFCPIDEGANKLVPYTFEEFKRVAEKTSPYNRNNLLNRCYKTENNITYYIELDEIKEDGTKLYKINASTYILKEDNLEDYNSRFSITPIYKKRYSYYYSYENEKYISGYNNPFTMTLKALYERLKPHYIEVYLTNGKLCRRDYFYD